MITDEMRNGIIVQIPIPDQFVGLWCIATPYGTHGSYEVITEDMVFESESHATAYRNKKYEESIRGYYPVMQLDKDYPVWQKRMFICGLSEKELNNKK